MGRKGAATAFIAMLGPLLMTLGLKYEFFADNPEVLLKYVNGAMWILGGIAASLATWLSGQPQWERINRIIQAVIPVIEADIGDRPKTEKRNKAITMIIEALPGGKYGIKGYILKAPFLGRYLVGRLVDQIVSGTRNVMQKVTLMEAKANLASAEFKNAA